MGKGVYQRRSLGQRFWSLVDVRSPNECWNWKGWVVSRSKRYGGFDIAGKTYYAHRISYEMFNGRSEGKTHIRHTCGNSLCVNPDHLICYLNGDGSLRDRFWSKVEKGDGCWLWRGGMNPFGYGHFSYVAGGKNRISIAHRLAYMLTKGPIPNGLEVMHSCDVRACVNPDHLSVGTHSDNMRDCVAKGRENRVRPRIGAEKARDILQRYAAGETGYQIGRDMGVNVQTVYRVLRGDVYSYVWEEFHREEAAA